MSSSNSDPGLESELIDLDSVPFTRMRELDSEPLRRSQRHVVERAGLVHAAYRSGTSTGGERVD